MMFNRLYSIVLLFAISVVANAQSWTDVTDLFVKNADFMQGDAYWQGTNFGNVNTGFRDAEYWNKNFTKYQEVSGLPKGTYRITMYGFYRIGGYNNEYSL